jgi:putative membrane protein
MTFIFFSLLLMSMGYSSLHLNTQTMFVVSVMMFLTCVSSAAHLLGSRSAATFVALASGMGWFAEFMGERYGWFFGEYHYTDALGVKIAGVPMVIPIMWFNLAYIGLIMSFLILERRPFQRLTSLMDMLRIAILGSVLVTAYDLAADPYMISVIKAWIMVRKDGWWFGETLVGFVGWFTVALSILMAFLFYSRRKKWSLPKGFGTAQALIPVAMYFCWMIFQVMYGYPVETRTVSAFVLGTPILIVILSVKHWKGFRA